jgi:hypothetical protein
VWQLTLPSAARARLLAALLDDFMVKLTTEITHYLPPQSVLPPLRPSAVGILSSPPVAADLASEPARFLFPDLSTKRYGYAAQLAGFVIQAKDDAVDCLGPAK